MKIDWARLRAAATDVMRRAYAPYSKFPVGAAALVDDGRIVVGCNVENAGYGVTLCAECGVVSQLHASGGGRLVALSCVDAIGDPLMPCGRCRQLLWEHGGADCLVDADPAPRRMAELLPHAFDVADLDAVRGPVDHGPVVPARLAAWRGRGTVFVHADLIGGNRCWTGYWERSEGSFADLAVGQETGLETAAGAGAECSTTPGSAAAGAGAAGPAAAGDRPEAGQEVGILEEAPAWPELADAVGWGRARTSRVVVIEPSGAVLWAGSGDPPAGITRRWNPHQTHGAEVS